MDGFIIRTGNGQNLKEQMVSEMREQYRGDGWQSNTRVVGHEFEGGYREGFRDGYNQGRRDAYGTNASENRNQNF